MGHETPLSIFIRRAAWKNPAFCKALFGECEAVPGFVQYHPEHIYLESVHGELVVTADTATPLLRYNLHDRAHVFSYEYMVGLLEKHGLRQAAKKYGLEKYVLPFVALEGRTDVAVTFYALNIYPEHAKACAEVGAIGSVSTGSYLVYSKLFRRAREEKLFFEFELQEGVSATKALIRDAGKQIAAALMNVNSEFRKLYAALGDRALPHIGFVPTGSLNIPRHARGMLAMKGKKPKMIQS